MNLSAYYNRTGDPDKALEYARKAIELDPKSDRAWFQKGRADERKGSLDAAVDALNQAIALNPRASSYYYVLADCLPASRHDRRKPKALEMFKRLEQESSELEKKRRSGAVLPAARSVAGRDASVSSGDSRSHPRRRFLRMLGGSAAAAPDARARRHPADARAQSPGPVVFTDVTAAAGLLQARNVSGSPDNKQFLLEEMGCGAAFFDYDNDGWLDIFLVNGSSLDPKVRDSKPSSYLFHNNRDGTFTDVTKKAGLTHSGWGQACCVGDYDNDGFDDLFVTYWGRNVLYHNNGDGTFTDVSEKAGVAGSGTRWGAGCCFLDYDRDGHLDLFVASYVNFDPAKAPRPGESAYCRYNDIPVPCGPQGFAGGTNILYRNRGDGTFADVSEASGIARPRGPSTMVFVGSNWQSYGLLRDGRGGGGFRQRRMARHLRRLRQRAEPALSQQPRRDVPGDRGPGRLRASTRTASPCPAWASASAISTRTAGWTSCGRTSPSR